MEKYGNIQDLVDKPEPSEIFLEARNIAGFQLQKQFNRLNQQSPNSKYDKFKWIKKELTYPSFEDFTFTHKNVIFAVVIELTNSQGSSFTQQQKDKLLKACEENNLIPCLFRIKIKENNQNIFSNLFKNKNSQNDYELIPQESGWNLFDPKTNIKINPEVFSNDKQTRMSSWELTNFAIQITITEIKKLGFEVLTFCDLPSIYPQIWFKETDNKVNWVLVKHVTTDQDLDYKEKAGIDFKNPQVSPYDGYFSAVQFVSSKTLSSTDLYRSDEMFVQSKGIVRIYEA